MLGDLFAYIGAAAITREFEALRRHCQDHQITPLETLSREVLPALAEL
jgi:hypothetical protein